MLILHTAIHACHRQAANELQVAGIALALCLLAIMTQRDEL